MEKKAIDFSIGIFDNLSEVSLEKLKNDINNCKIYGIGVYTDRVVVEEFKTYPINNIEKRKEIAKSIDDVKFVFELDTTDSKKIKEIIQNEAMKFLL